MGLRNICTTQETSRKLAEAGFPQEGGIAYWCKEKEKWVLLPYLPGHECVIHTPNIIDWRGFKEIEKYRAWDFVELWELLPDRIEEIEATYYLEMEKAVDGKGVSIGHISCEAEMFRDIQASKPQEAAAELALWCVKEGYLKLEEG